MSDPVLAALAARRPAQLQALCAFLSIPSLSPDPQALPHMAEARAFLMTRLAAAGFDRVETLPAEGHPPVYAEWLKAPGAPTVLVYGHYDVQPPDPLAAWISPPFAPTIRDGRLHARGASDDKGPLFTALTAIETLLAVEGRLPVNLKLLLEGEEEVGSRNLEATVCRHRDRLAADFVLSADGARWRADLPAVNVGSRGIAVLELSLATADKDLHSGRYGGGVVNPLNALARLIASLHDADGRVAVAGFYDGVLPPTPAERAALAGLPFDAAAFLAAIGAAEGGGEAGHTLLERLWYRPTLDLNGLWGGYQGPGAKTVIPHEAHAKLSCRLVPGQDPRRVAACVAAHLRAHCPPGARLTLTGMDHGSPAYLLPQDHPALAVVTETLTALHGRAPVAVRIGATLPISELFRRLLGIDTVMFSFSTADEDFHAPNEFFRLESFDLGARAWVDALRRLGRLTPGVFDPFRRS